MKRAFSIVGFLLILLLGAGPASTALGCVLSNSAMAPSCPMGMSAMDPDCPMSHAIAAADCTQDCCNRTAPVATVLSGIPVKPKLVAAALPMASLTVPTAAEGYRRSDILPAYAASSPPRYILLRVFRI
jgi:hypothetical protein